MIFLSVLSKIILWPHYSGPQELGGSGSLNRLNPRFLRHCRPLTAARSDARTTCTADTRTVGMYLGPRYACASGL